MIENSIQIDEKLLDEYVQSAKDACFYTGLTFFRSNNKNDPEFNDASFLSFTLVPSPFPRSEYEYAINLQPHWNKLIHLISNDYQFLYNSLKSVIESDSFVSQLWTLYKKVYDEGIKQRVSLGVIRCDYMLDREKFNGNNVCKLSQIEINTFACGGCATPSKVADMHRYMLRITDNNNLIDKAVPNDCLKTIAKALVQAWSMYNNPNALFIMLVRNRKENISDHRLIEYEVLAMEPRIRFKRMKFMDVYERGRLDENMKLFIDDTEVGLILYKSGFSPSDYSNGKEWDARLMIERSMAIKAPNIQYHLCCLKKIQEAISQDYVLEKFINDKNVVNSMRATFVKQYAIDVNDEELIKEMINNPEDYVLKPQREGGGNNIYGYDIKEFYMKLEDKSQLNQYILMKRIKYVDTQNYLIRPIKQDKIKKENIIVELGVIGVILGTTTNEIILNNTASYSNLCKVSTSNEAGIMAGYGGYDTMYFV